MTRGPKAMIGLGFYAMAAYASFYAYNIYKLDAVPENIKDPKHQTLAQGRFDQIAQEYDDELGWSEFLMGMGIRRRSLLKHAYVNAHIPVCKLLVTP
jgi:hypothetical protein